MTSLPKLLKDVRACTHCAKHLPLGPRPIVRIAPSATLLIIGQAPGTKVHESGVPWDDKSGDRLREWLAVDKDTFYDENCIAIMPMGFCYPGVQKSGGDAPPRPECAPLWHDDLRAHLPNIKLTLLIGMYAQAYYLGTRRKKTMTDTVKAWPEYQPDGLLPMPHPSWRSTGWLKKNPWFEKEVLPVLRKAVG
ncbi:MAG: uracil-DNA glycosylase family protein [Rhodospirillaceae bacterium]|nr:uracil-DNA glycosylase family protein [Rhodospirillaceae bacterium]MBT5241684.1 uracil-DNA glycosylase family protein [Rhodospirillaceae bacterium]MBT5566856.1 uracil-DNA glycosylase family protein [Rhodospirillaceae bacterium]MBT6090457.1 uracil-DNA glycosylase family protein [Rhodospirillaceae bacterium]MBT6961037.1 uracil-DNA glycosylase family protein [Rhodospirillaceae bacterium]